jgi:hypothetical protein
MKIFLPKTFIPENELEVPVIFLAGPIRGGDDWQYRFIKEIEKDLERGTIVNPVRYEGDHPLFSVKEKGDENHFESQTLWERYYLATASKKGCIVFYLPCESKINPRTSGLPYARDSYGELGEWRGRMIYDNKINLVVGADKDFPGLDVIEKNFKAMRPDFGIHYSLEDTVRKTIEIIHGQK